MMAGGETETPGVLALADVCRGTCIVKEEPYGHYW